MVMEAVPLHLKEANAFVAQHHRHNLPTTGGKFAVGAADDAGNLVGVAIAGRPVARRLDNGKTLEVLRVCTDGTRNANSFLYGRVKRIAHLMGYGKAITSTLEPRAALHCGRSGPSQPALWKTMTRRTVPARVSPSTTSRSISLGTLRSFGKNDEILDFSRLLAHFFRTL